MKYKIITVLIIQLCGMVYSSTPSDVTINYYRIYCITEAQNVYEWNTISPTTCPNNTAHIINPNSISIVNQRAPSVTTIQQETVPTDGWFKTETIVINAATGPNVTTEVTQSWPFNISLLNLYFTTSGDNTGDLLNIYWAKDLPIGVITNDIAVGATTMTVPGSVIQNVYVGFTIALDDGTNHNNCGRIIALDSINNIITFEIDTTNSFSSSTPTAIEITVNPVELTFGPAADYSIARNVIGGSHIPANQVATLDYLNNGSTAKELYVNMEYFY